MLSSQERDIEAKNASLQEQYENILILIDKLTHELASSHSAVDTLTNIKEGLAESGEKMQGYGSEIATINKRYVALKRAYDALDIEYAQLYEKHTSG